MRGQSVGSTAYTTIARLCTLQHAFTEPRAMRHAPSAKRQATMRQCDAQRVTWGARDASRCQVPSQSPEQEKARHGAALRRSTLDSRLLTLACPSSGCVLTIPPFRLSLPPIPIANGPVKPGGPGGPVRPARPASAVRPVTLPLTNKSYGTSMWPAATPSWSKSRHKPRICATWRRLPFPFRLR